MAPKVFLRCKALLPIFLILSACAEAVSTYQIDTTLSGSSFFSGFDFFTGADPTHGFVNFLSYSDAANLGLAGPGPGGSSYMGVDHTTFLPTSGPGRNSVRISTKKSWTHGLFITDIAHMPGSICGTWPSYWMLGPNWPSAGEIDIIEGVNSNHTNLMSLHTSSNCTIAGSGQSGTLQTNNCDGNTNFNAGCGTTASTDSSYGTSFNTIGGGVYATEWTSQYIKIWFFPRSGIPNDITNGNPDPSTWGIPQANFQGSCDMDSHFYQQSLIIDTTFCGDWGANVWNSDSTCKNLGPTCAGYVASNPAVFKDAYWSINSVKVYQLGPPFSKASVEIVSSASSNTSRQTTSTSAKFEGSTKKTSIETSSSIQWPSTSTKSQSEVKRSAISSKLHTSTTKVPDLSSIKKSSSSTRAGIETNNPSISSFAKRTSSQINTIMESKKPTTPTPKPTPKPTSTRLTSPSSKATSSLSKIPTPPLPRLSPNKSPRNLPIFISTFAYLACLTSSSNFVNFRIALTSPVMTTALCHVSCASHAFAGLYGEDCYCANQLGPHSYDAVCDGTCPGAEEEVCGGGVWRDKEGEEYGHIFVRAFSVWRNEDVAPGPVVEADLAKQCNAEDPPSIDPSPTLATYGPATTGGLTSVKPASSVLGKGQGGDPSSVQPGTVEITSTMTAPCSSQTINTSKHPQPLSSVVPASSVFGVGNGGGADPSQYYVTVLTTTYIDICPTSPSTLSIHTMTSTLTLCSCVHPALITGPQIPMITTTKTCASCGIQGQSLTLTLTVPYVEANHTTSTKTGNSAKGGQSTKMVMPVEATPSVVWLASTRTVKPVKATDGHVNTGGARRNDGVFGAVVVWFGFAVLVM